MLILYYIFLKSPLLLLIPYVLQVIPYFFILRKLGYKGVYALVPPVSEFLITRKVFQKKRTFFNAYMFTAIMVGFAYYVSPYRGVGITYLIIGFLVYSIFLVRLYRRLGKAFGKKWYFTLAAIVFTPIALLKLGLDSSRFTKPVFKPRKTYNRRAWILRRIAYASLSVVEILLIVSIATFFAIQQRFPRFIVDVVNKDTYESTMDITDTGEVVSRKDTLGTKLNEVLADTPVREKFYPDHKNDKDAVVFVYIVGSNLEDARGLASVNIEQMLEATKKGSALKFVLETGGSERWFTGGIKNNSYGRYEIENGKLTKVMDLPGSTNMATANELSQFLKWCKENYSADRTMLVMWDHGGGVTSGFGKDDVNGGLAQSIYVSGIAEALEAADMKFDMIGFDACLMQDIEIAEALEPYADYYIASEETESGYGWPFMYAFGSLAKDPGLDTEEFARQLISSYDPYNTITNNNRVNTSATLSLVDLPLAAAAYDKLNDLYAHTADAIVDDASVYANISIAADNTYRFEGDQIDLINFLEILDEVDYSGHAYAKEKLADLIDTIKASVIYRNGNSAEGINGIAFTFGNEMLSNYILVSRQLQALNLTNEKKAYDTYFSIMAAQQKKSLEKQEVSLENGLLGYIANLLVDMTYDRQDWYISGFEDYDDSEALVNVPLTPVAKGYKIELPDPTWNIITDVQTMVYQKVEDMEGVYSRYLGNDYLGGADENGHNLVAADENWVHVNGQIVCYEADQVKHTKDGDVYTGRIKARLNKTRDIYILIEWDPSVKDTPESAHVIGYIPAEERAMPSEKGNLQFVPGDTIEFLFQYYDKEGNYIETLPVGKRIRISRQERLKVLDLPMEPCTIEFGGILKDVYQRMMTTEMMEYTIGEETVEEKTVKEQTVVEEKLIIGTDYRLPYFAFGEGEKNFILLPGASMTSILGSEDGIKNLFASYTKEYRIYVFDVPEDLDAITGIEQLADIIADAADALGIKEADVYGASMGGMTAQKLAIRYPDLVRTLSLASSMSRSNELSEEVISGWADTSNPEELSALVNTHVYSEVYYSTYEEIFHSLEKAADSKGVERLHNLTRMILEFTSYDELEKIQCPVYVYTGSADNTLGVEASREIAEKLGCFIKVYDGYSHAVYDEYQGFYDEVFANLKQ